MRTLGELAAILALAAALFYQGPAHQLLWAFVIAVTVTSFVRLERRGERTSRFWVRIRVKADLLLQHGVATQEQLKVLSGTPEQKPGRRSALREGIAFTLLDVDAHTGEGLVYWNDVQKFSSRVTCAIPLEELAVPPGALDDADDVEERSPYIILEQIKGGLGVTVQPVQGDSLLQEPRERLAHEVAFLPWAAFDLEQWAGRMKSGERDAALAEHGWTELSCETRITGSPGRLDHEYLTVVWDRL